MGLKWLRRGEYEIKSSMRRLYQTTLNLMQQTTIGNSMLEYASASLDETEVIGGGVRVLSLEKTS